MYVYTVYVYPSCSVRMVQWTKSDKVVSVKNFSVPVCGSTSLFRFSMSAKMPILLFRLGVDVTETQA